MRILAGACHLHGPVLASFTRVLVVRVHATDTHPRTGVCPRVCKLVAGCRFKPTAADARRLDAFDFKRGKGYSFRETATPRRLNQRYEFYRTFEAIKDLLTGC